MVQVIDSVKSNDGSIKYVFGNELKNKFEAIYFKQIPSKPTINYHICISTQSGCAMECKFCATAYGGFFNNLNDQEMLDQVEKIQYELFRQNIEQPTFNFNILLMGMGESMVNYNNVINFIERARTRFLYLNKILVSSVGISNKINELASISNLSKLKLYISVHSPYDKERIKIMPITKKFNLESVIQACINFASKSNTKVKATYLLLKGINDSEQHAIDFAKLLNPKYFEAQIQLYNITPELPYQRVDDKQAMKFNNIITSHGVNCLVRVSCGQDIDGGCGQLVKNLRKHVNTT